MPHRVLTYPAAVYPGEADSECPEAKPILGVLILNLGRHGPSPPGYKVKTLGKKMGGLWQINFKAPGGRQVRVLYAPYMDKIVLFRIHKKGSSAEQQQAYNLAMKRKSTYETLQSLEQRTQHHVGSRTHH